MTSHSTALPEIRIPKKNASSGLDNQAAFVKLPGHALLPSGRAGRDPFFIALIGKPATGKSVACFAIADSMFRKYFDCCLVYCPHDEVEMFKRMRQKRVHVYTDFEEDKFKDFLDALEVKQDERFKAGKPRLRCLLVLDDRMSNKALLSDHVKTPLGYAVSQRRHLNLSIIMCIQDLMQASSRQIRGQLSHAYLFGVDDRQVHVLYEAFGSSLTSEQFSSMLRTVTAQPHHFVLVDLQAPDDKKFRDGYKKYLHEKKVKTAVLPLLDSI